MERITSLMMKCLKCKIFDCGFERSDFEGVSVDEWKKVFSLSAEHDLVHIVGDFVLKNNLITDEELISAFNMCVLAAFHRFCGQNYELECIRNLFEKNDIPFVVLKGPVIRKLYPDEWLRQSCDIDILVEECFLTKAQKVLEEKLEFTSESQNYHDISMYSSSGVHLELHFSILEHIEKIDVLLKNAWQYTEAISKDSSERRFTPEFMIYHIAAHMYYHFLSGGCGIKPFIDLKILLEKTEFNKVKLSELLSKAGIEVFFERVIQLVEIWFGDSEYDELSRRVEDYILKGGVYGITQNRVLSNQSSKGKSKSFWSRIFMPYSLLCVRYANKNIKKWQIPYYQVVRWIDIIRDGSVKKGIQELKIQATTQQEELEKTQQMMKALGL